MTPIRAMAINVLAMWHGNEPHEGGRGVCAPPGQQQAVMDPRCWACLSWAAEDEVPLYLRSEDRTMTPDERAELIVEFRKILAAKAAA